MGKISMAALLFAVCISSCVTSANTVTTPANNTSNTGSNVSGYNNNNTAIIPQTGTAKATPITGSNEVKNGNGTIVELK